MVKLVLSRLGSFQSGEFYSSENPLEEVWDHVESLGVCEFMNRFAQPSGDKSKWDDIVLYSTFRIRQAVEFRRSARTATILTAPLLLYYSFLNLTRAFLAIRSEVLPTRKKHGLSFSYNSELLSNKAKPCQGTFTEFLNGLNFSWTRDTEFTLRQCFSHIPEIISEFYQYGLGISHVVPIEVKAKTNGDVTLRFNSEWVSESEFRRDWQKLFPALANCCELATSGANLKVLNQEGTQDYSAISSFCSNNLEVDLKWSQNPLWYVFRKDQDALSFPRPAYYLGALFILGNIVRYQPEIMKDVVKPDREIGFFLKRFLRVAERYYPQLMLSWLYDKNVFYGNA